MFVSLSLGRPEENARAACQSLRTAASAVSVRRVVEGDLQT